jgi:glucose/arabinose dehydrogenase
MARLRWLVILLLVAFAVVFLVLRGGGGETEPTAPSAATTITSQPGSATTGPSSGTSAPGTVGSTTAELPPLQGLTLEVIDEDYNQPTAIRAPAGDDRLFIVQRVGVIRAIDANNEMLDPAFLAIDDRVLVEGIEQGLLGLAFHPDFARNGRFFVYYVNRQGQRQLSEFAVSVDDPNRADPESEKVLFQLDHPENATDIRHYAGDVHFGPDGNLWVSSGDGADARGQGQNPDTMFAAIIRIDVDQGDPYGIPTDNPFVDGGGAPEVWAYGLRNPYRFWIDPVDGVIYIGDVGLETWEEINAVPIDEGGGYNFGWANMEGTRCLFETDCDPANYTQAVLAYPNSIRNPESDQPGGCAVTGGVVYRGAAIPEINGHYFYSDWCNQRIRSFRLVEGQATEITDWTDDVGEVGQVNGFGIGGDGEMYLVTHDGNVARFMARR